MDSLVFIILTLCSLSSPPFIKSINIQTSFSVDLIHRDSPMSPFHNPSTSQFNLIKKAAFRSNSRLDRFSLSLLSNESPESIILPNNGDYLMRIFIGTPPIEKLVIADTGSDLTWVQCSPCMNCFPQNTPFYDTTKSSTFSNVQCDSHSCTLLPKEQQLCGKSNECFYSYHYGDRSFSIGELGFDSISFGSSNSTLQGANSVTNGNITFPKSIFGCGYYNIFTSDNSGKASGLVGLGAGPLSLISQLGDSIGRKFSYCLVPFASNSTSKLRFGNEAIITGEGVVSTPLIIKSSTPTFYYVNLEGVTVGQKMFHTGQTDGNIIIDSGTTLTYLEPPIFDNFITSMKEAIGIEQVEDSSSPFSYCFTYQPDINFPRVAFHFTGGANVTLEPKNMLLLYESNLLCLAVVSSNIEGVSILGNVAQIDFQVEYDLGGKKLSFVPSDCAKN
ncbi:aspartic proteinase CDR1-like [Vicia villosa]|uniref:aspartic proteinase CDR1-like n=1 Tax=Vicia villosa TaxID=3911 RepID=UPI00273AF82D|nr:aspartic proteinase CDR1-like [Vicia villosa]